MKKQIAFFGLMMFLSHAGLMGNTTEKYKSNLTEAEQSIYQACIESFTAKNLTSITDEQIEILMKRQKKVKQEIEYSKRVIKTGWRAALPLLPIWLIPLVTSIEEANSVGFLMIISIILPSLFYVKSKMSSALENKEKMQKELDLIDEILRAYRET